MTMTALSKALLLRHVFFKDYEVHARKAFDTLVFEVGRQQKMMRRFKLEVLHHMIRTCQGDDLEPPIANRPACVHKWTDDTPRLYALTVYDSNVFVFML